MSERPRILSVGQCGLDGPRIKRSLEKTFNASVTDASSLSEATDEIADGGYDLVLVNRILDATGESGQDVIEAAVAGNTKAMLVSNFEDAQEQAVAAGAAPGFGKKVLDSDEANDRIRAALS